MRTHTEERVVDEVFESYSYLLFIVIVTVHVIIPPRIRTQLRVVLISLILQSCTAVGFEKNKKIAIS